MLNRQHANDGILKYQKHDDKFVFVRSFIHVISRFRRRHRHRRVLCITKQRRQTPAKHFSNSEISKLHKRRRRKKKKERSRKHLPKRKLDKHLSIIRLNSFASKLLYAFDGKVYAEYGLCDSSMCVRHECARECFRRNFFPYVVELTFGWNRFWTMWNGKFPITLQQFGLISTHTRTRFTRFNLVRCVRVSAAIRLLSIHRPFKRSIESWKCRLTFHAHSHNRCDILAVHIQHIAFGHQTTYSTVSVCIWYYSWAARHRWMAEKCGKSLKNAIIRSTSRTWMRTNSILHFPFDAMIFPELHFHWRCSFFLLCWFSYRSFVSKIMHIHFNVASAHSSDLHSVLKLVDHRSYDDDEKCMRETARLQIVNEWARKVISFCKGLWIFNFVKFILNVSRVKNLIKSIFFATRLPILKWLSMHPLYLLFGKSSMSFDSFVQWKFLCNRPVYRSLLHTWHS